MKISPVKVVAAAVGLVAVGVAAYAFLPSASTLGEPLQTAPVQVVEPSSEAPQVKPAVPTKPVMPEGSPPPAPELNFDAQGNVIMPKIVAPAPPKPPGGPQAPELTPEMLEAAKAHLAKKRQAEATPGAVNTPASAAEPVVIELK